MSKSIGNTVDPLDLIKKYDINSIRYYFLTSGPQNHDIDFLENKILDVFYKDIPDVLNNLILRVTNIKIFGDLQLASNVNWNQTIYVNEIIDILNLVDDAKRFLDIFDFMTASNKIHLILLSLNNYIHKSQFWIKSKTESQNYLNEIFCFTLEGIRIVSILLYPFIPDISKNIHEFLGLEKKYIKEKNCFFRMKKEVPKEFEILRKYIKDEEFNSTVETHYFNIDENKRDLIFIKKLKNTNYK